MLAGQELVQDETERIEIASVIDRCHAERRFRREVRNRAEDDARRGEQPLRGRGLVRRRRDRRDIGQSNLGEAEVDQLDDVVRAIDQDDVGRLHVTVDHAHGVSRSETGRELPSDGHGALHRERSASDDLVQRDARHVLENEKVRAVFQLPEVGRRGDVRVLNVRAGDGFALEPRDELG